MSDPAHDSRSQVTSELLRRPAGASASQDLLRNVLASMLAGRTMNQGVLTATLGMPTEAFDQMWSAYFPGAALKLENGPGEDIAEFEDLLHLLLEYRAGLRESEAWMAHIVAYACCGRNHLWQDLGLANRGELTLLMTTAFPALTELNMHDMKWKKFIYRHYCKREGIYVCPAPSCGECKDYDKCFSKEE